MGHVFLRQRRGERRGNFRSYAKQFALRHAQSERLSILPFAASHVA